MRETMRETPPGPGNTPPETGRRRQREGDHDLYGAREHLHGVRSLRAPDARRAKTRPWCWSTPTTNGPPRPAPIDVAAERA